MATSLRSCERKTGFVVGKNYRLQDIQLSENNVDVSDDDRDDFRHRKLAGPLSQPLPAPHGLELSGGYRARTGDLLVANQALSQLS